MYSEIYPFLLDLPNCWHAVVHDLTYFCDISCNGSSFTSDFI